MNSYKRIPVEGINCPFCLQPASYVLFEVTSSEAAMHFVSPWRDSARNSEVRSIIERLWQKQTCQMIECGHCSGIFAFPFIGGDASFYQTANDCFYPKDRWEFAEALRLSSYISSALEIGAGDGAFVGRLIQHGVSANAITVLEYSSYGMDTIRAKFPGVNVQHGEALASLPATTFGHVFLFQVLEHLDNLDGFMCSLRRVLAKDGLGFISVPNPSRTELGELGGHGPDMPPNHISRFSREAMNNLAARHNFSVEAMLDEPFSWKQAFPEFLRFRFLRLAQKKGSIPARIHASLAGTSRKVAASLYALALVPDALMKLTASRKTGPTRLFVLKKIQAEGREE